MAYTLPPGGMSPAITDQIDPITAQIGYTSADLFPNTPPPLAPMGGFAGIAAGMAPEPGPDQSDLIGFGASQAMGVQGYGPTVTAPTEPTQGASWQGFRPADYGPLINVSYQPPPPSIDDVKPGATRPSGFLVNGQDPWPNIPVASSFDPLRAFRSAPAPIQNILGPAVANYTRTLGYKNEYAPVFGAISRPWAPPDMGVDQALRYAAETGQVRLQTTAKDPWGRYVPSSGFGEG